MPGKAAAVANGESLATEVVRLGKGLGLQVRTQVRVARRLWGAVRKIDVVMTHVTTKKTLGIECKFQSSQGTAEEKIPSTIQDIGAWPIPGIVVFAGDGFSPNMRAFLYSTGKAVDLEDLGPWLLLFFGIDGEDVFYPNSRSRE